MPVFEPTVLHTERLALRWVVASDAAAMFAVFSDPAVMRYWSSSPWTDMAQAEQAIALAEQGYASGTALRFGVELAASGELIGHVVLYAFHEMNRRCEIGYALGRPHWGRGYLGEAMAAVLDYAFRVLDLHRVEADVDPRNAASAAALERHGFRQEGYLRERWIVGGEICDSLFYGLLRRDWEARADGAATPGQ